MTEPIIRVEHLSKRYRIGLKDVEALTWGDRARRIAGAPFSYLRQTMRPPTEEETLWALKDISFEVAQGEVVGIIGKNGAGKSTLLKILSRIMDPTGGRAVMRGRVGSLLEVGTGFHPDLTGRENIYLSGTILGMKRREIDRKLEEIIEFAEIGRFLDTPVKRYSSGMNVRLGFAVAAHLEPEILIVDEVLSVGDSSFQKKCLGKMGAVASEGRTVLFVSHNTPTMLRLCSRGVLLKGGYVLSDGPISAVVRDYLTELGLVRHTLSWKNLDDAPGSDQVKLVSANITNSRGEPCSTVNIEEPLYINYSYFVPQAGSSFRCVANLHTQGTLAFTSMETSEAVRREPGYYTSSLFIPGNLLAEGDYSIDISFFSSRGSKIRHLYLTEALAVNVYDPMTGNSSRGDYAERYGGVMRPRLPWQMTYLGEKLVEAEGDNLELLDLPQNLTDEQFKQREFQY